MLPGEIKVYQLKEKLPIPKDDFVNTITSYWPSKYEYKLSVVNTKTDDAEKIYEAYKQFNMLYAEGVNHDITRQLIDGDMIVIGKDHYAVGSKDFVFIGKSD